MRRLSVWILLCILWNAGTNLTLAEGESDLPRIISVKALVLPASLQTVIESKFPDYSVFSERDYRFVETPDNREYGRELREEMARLRKDMIENIGTSKLPWVCWGDFNGDSRRDVTLYLLQKPDCSTARTGKLREEKLVIFHQTATSYEPVVIDSGQTAGPWCEFIATRPAGKYLTVKGKGYTGVDPFMPDSVIITAEGIETGCAGKASELVYWEDGSYKRVTISD